MTTLTFYEILEVPPNATPLEIKKAYRRLALQHHPDRNQGSLESAERFKQIGEAYECLSDSRQRSEYDHHPQTFGRTTATASTASSANAPLSSHYNRNRRQRVDPFAQFDHLFRTDPFFQEAFQDLDEAFAKRFQQQPQPLAPSNATTSSSRDHTSTTTTSNKSNHQEGWIPWMLRQCGVQVQMTSHVSDGRGGMTTSTYASSNRNSYTSKKRKTHVDAQGRQVIIQSMEQNGNQIQDTLINDELVERRVNGVVDVQRIH
jgi:curved DNA-binding protein CbpA